MRIGIDCRSANLSSEKNRDKKAAKENWQNEIGERQKDDDVEWKNPLRLQNSISWCFSLSLIEFTKVKRWKRYCRCQKRKSCNRSSHQTKQKSNVIKGLLQKDRSIVAYLTDSFRTIQQFFHGHAKVLAVLLQSPQTSTFQLSAYITRTTITSNFPAALWSV